jgi:spore germination cell wall hydrolase CwlJ-like protein
MNRVQDPRYPKNICGVVKEKSKSTCQFSWYCEDNKVVRNRKAYQEALDIAIHVYSNDERMYDITKGALFYHADYVSLRKIGVQGLEKTTKIGRHIFYKEQ